MPDRKKKPVLVQFISSETEKDGDQLWIDESASFNSTAAAEKWLRDNAEPGYTYRIVTVERENLTLTVETKRKLTNG